MVSEVYINFKSTLLSHCSLILAKKQYLISGQVGSTSAISFTNNVLCKKTCYEMGIQTDVLIAISSKS